MRINWRAAAGPAALVCAIALLPVLAGAVMRSEEPQVLDPELALPAPTEGPDLVTARGKDEREARERPKDGRPSRDGAERERGKGDGGRPGHPEEPDPRPEKGGGGDAVPASAPAVPSPAAAPASSPATVAPVPVPAPIPVAPAPVAPDNSGGGPSAGYREFGP